VSDLKWIRRSFANIVVRIRHLGAFFVNDPERVSTGWRGTMRVRAAICGVIVAACTESTPAWQPPAGSFSLDSAALTDSERPEPVMVARVRVTPAFIDSLPVTPILGRSFVRDDFGARRVALISDKLWRTHLGARPDLIGRTVTLGTEPVIIVGVLPSGFDQLGGAETWVARQ
jgi:hypothetical protein